MLVLCTDSLRGYGLNRIFQFAKEAGFDAIDLSVSYGHFDSFNENYIKELVSQHKINVHAVSAPAQISNDKIKELVPFTKNIGAKILIIQPPRLLDQKLAHWMKREIPKLRDKEKISIALENSPSGTFFLGLFPSHALSNTEDLKKFKHISLDTSRLGEKKQDLIRTYALFRKYLVHIHISNIHRGKKYAPPQDGILPLESFLTKLKRDNYPGAISVKINPNLLNVGDDEKLIENLKSTIKYLNKYYTNVEVIEEDTSAEEQAGEI